MLITVILSDSIFSALFGITICEGSKLHLSTSCVVVCLFDRPDVTLRTYVIGRACTFRIEYECPFIEIFSPTHTFIESIAQITIDLWLYTRLNGICVLVHLIIVYTYYSLLHIRDSTYIDGWWFPQQRWYDGDLLCGFYTKNIDLWLLDWTGSASPCTWFVLLSHHPSHFVITIS